MATNRVPMTFGAMTQTNLKTYIVTKNPSLSGRTYHAKNINNLRATLLKECGGRPGIDGYTVYDKAGKEIGSLGVDLELGRFPVWSIGYRGQVTSVYKVLRSGKLGRRLS